MPKRRQPTKAFPADKPRAGWVVRERIAPFWSANSRFYEFEYEVYEDMAERIRLGGKPFIILNHKAQFREDHQRIVTGPSGGLMHVDAGEVLDLAAFSQTPAHYHRDPDGKYRNGLGGELDPFLFPSAPWDDGDGNMELDPQWQRELFTVPVAQQVAEARQRRLDRVEANFEQGDRRGTTLNLAVSVGDSDAYEFNGSTFVANNPCYWSDTSSPTIYGGARFLGTLVLDGATINTATLQLYCVTNDDPECDLHFERADAGAAFSAGASPDHSTRTWTTANVTWSATNIGTGAYKSSPDLATPLQEVIDNHTPSTLVVLGTDNAQTSKIFTCTQWETNSSQAPLLDIDFTQSGGTLDDTNLLVRYYIDEAASGNSPTEISDDSGVGSALNLTLNYGSGNMTFTEDAAGNRGLISSATTGTQRADSNGDISAGNKVYDGIHGAQKATIEVVILLNDSATGFARVMAINGDGGEAARMGLLVQNNGSGLQSWELFYHGGNMAGTTLPPTGVRMVVHAVYDSTLATAAQRCRLYVNGSLIAELADNTNYPQNSTFDLTAHNVELILLNRDNAGAYDRSIDGTLYYAAMYDDAFTAARVASHAEILIQDDDTPAPPPAGLGPEVVAMLAQSGDYPQ